MKVTIHKKILVLIGCFYLFSCEEMQQERYSSISECKTKEMQKCPDSRCAYEARKMCDEVLNKMYDTEFLTERAERCKEDRKKVELGELPSWYIGTGKYKCEK